MTRNLRARKIGIENEYIENIDTPIIRRYNSLSDVPKEPSDTFANRYAAEARLHRYHESSYISSNPIIINSWTQDINLSTMMMSDSSEKSTSSGSSHSSSSSSSSKSSKRSRSSPQLAIRSPPHRRQPLYANTIRNSPNKIDSIASSATPSETSSATSSATSSSTSAPTMSTNNNNVNDQVQMSQYNHDLSLKNLETHLLIDMLQRHVFINIMTPHTYHQTQSL